MNGNKMPRVPKKRDSFETRTRNSLMLALLALLSVMPSCLAQVKVSGSANTSVTIDASAPGRAFPHFWEDMFGSGRPILSLRESYRDDIRSVKAATDFRYVRFHAILSDDIGLFDIDPAGNPVYNFSYIDQIYDWLLANGIRPYVELSFMPRKMASAPATSEPFKFHHVWASPPRDYKLWDDMVSAFARHLIDRYGIDEVAQWYFEVWNEPDSDSWAGDPKQATYYQLYDHTARVIKKIDMRLRVGGPGTAESTWISAFLDHCHQNHVPIDFVSSHMYGDESAQDVFNTKDKIPRNRMVCMAVSKVRGEINASALPGLPFILSEFNASYMNKPEVTDTVYMGPWLADTIRQCDGSVDMMSYWTFSDVFEEEGVVKKPFYGGFGLIAEDGIPKPAFSAFALLHKLGSTRLNEDANSMLVTRRSDGTLVVALWDYAKPYGVGPKYSPPDFGSDRSRTFLLKVMHDDSSASVIAWRLDQNHGNVLRVYDAMGRPAFPSLKQITVLQNAGHMAPPEHLRLHKGAIQVTVPPQGLMLLEIGNRHNAEDF
jgi:xylan 1,4-beta-xylosidase